MTIYKAFFVFGRDTELAARVLKGEISVGKAESLLRSQATDTEEVSPVTTKALVAKVNELLSRDIDASVRRKAMSHLERCIKLLANAIVGVR